MFGTNYTFLFFMIFFLETAKNSRETGSFSLRDILVRSHVFAWILIFLSIYSFSSFAFLLLVLSDSMSATRFTGSSFVVDTTHLMRGSLYLWRFFRMIFMNISSSFLSACTKDFGVPFACDTVNMSVDPSASSSAFRRLDIP